MKLYSAPASPFVRKVHVALHETGLMPMVEIVPVSISPVSPGDTVPSRNPLGKIPALELDDGTALYDSRVITRYLDSLKPGVLYPTAPALWQTLVLEATGDGLMDAAVSMAYESRVRPAEMVYEPWLEAQWLKIDRSLGAIEARWMPHLQGPRDMAVYGIAVALEYLDFRHGPRNWRTNHPVLAAWHAEIASHPSLVATQPVG